MVLLHYWTSYTQLGSQCHYRLMLSMPPNRRLLEQNNSCKMHQSTCLLRGRVSAERFAILGRLIPAVASSVGSANDPKPEAKDISNFPNWVFVRFDP